MLVDKIKEIMQQTGLSPSLFADEVGINRASISHILAGRNKPSFPILLKIYKKFPQFGSDWIMEAKLEDPIEKKNNIKKEIKTPISDSPLAIKSTPEVKINLAKTVEKIVIFYSDKTFTEYTPSSD